MHRIEDLSDLLAILSSRKTEPLQFDLSPALKESLKGCLELGIKQIANFNPMIMTPRQLRPLADHPHLPTQRVWPKDFAKYLAGTVEDTASISVDRSLLAEGLSYLYDQHLSDRLESICGALKDLTKQLSNDRVEAPRAQVQEIADWLDKIQRSRPNDIARELRSDVKNHNEQRLLAKIQPPKLPPLK